MGGGVITEKCNHAGVRDCKFDASEKNSNTRSRGYGRNCEASSRKPRLLGELRILIELCISEDACFTWRFTC
jgi:hypothetical protein